MMSKQAGHCSVCNLDWPSNTKTYKFRDGNVCINPRHGMDKPFQSTTDIQPSHQPQPTTPDYLKSVSKIHDDLMTLARIKSTAYFAGRQSVTDKDRDIQAAVTYKGLVDLYTRRQGQ